MFPAPQYYTRRLAEAAAGDPVFARIATLVQQRGANPATAVIADFFPDDQSLCFGLLVTPEGRHFEFDYDWRQRDEADGILSEWEELTAVWKCGIYAEPITLGLQLDVTAT